MVEGILFYCCRYLSLCGDQLETPKWWHHIMNITRALFTYEIVNEDFLMEAFFHIHVQGYSWKFMWMESNCLPPEIVQNSFFGEGPCPLNPTPQWGIAPAPNWRPI